MNRRRTPNRSQLGQMGNSECCTLGYIDCTYIKKRRAELTKLNVNFHLSRYIIPSWWCWRNRRHLRVCSILLTAVFLLLSGLCFSMEQTFQYGDTMALQ